MIISKKRFEEMVAQRMRTEEEKRMMLSRFELFETRCDKRVDALGRRVDDMAEKLREIEARFRIPNNGVVYSVKDIPCDVTRAELVENPVEGMPCRK